MEGRKAGKSPYQNQGLGKSFSSFGRFLLLESGSLQVSSIFFAILNYLDFLTLYLHANIENKNRSTQISIHKAYLFFKIISHFQTSHFRSTVLRPNDFSCLEKPNCRTSLSQFFSAKKSSEEPSHMLSNKMFKNWLLKPPSPSESCRLKKGATGSELFRPIHQLNTKPQV